MVRVKNDHILGVIDDAAAVLKGTNDVDVGFHSRGRLEPPIAKMDTFNLFLTLSLDKKYLV
jgi:hypothetical protein